jgi:hypothetical protein
LSSQGCESTLREQRAYADVDAAVREVRWAAESGHETVMWADKPSFLF